MATEYPLSVVIKAVDRITAPMRKISGEMQKMAAHARKVNADLKAASKAVGFNALAGSVNNLTGALGRASNAAKGLLTRMALVGGGAVYAFNNQFIKTASMFENLETSLTTIEGSAEKAKQSMGFLRNMTVKTPFNMEEIAQTYRTMKGFGMDGQDGSLWALTEATAALGRNGEDLQGIAVQLGQAWGKMKLQANDIRPMIERGIPVWDLLEKASIRAGKHMSVAQLQQLSESGQLGRKAITALLQEMAIQYEGGNNRMMSTWTGMMSNLKDQWMFFTQAVMTSGVFDYLKGKAQLLLDTINKMAADGSLQRLAETVAKNIIAMFESIWNARHEIMDTLRGIRDGFLWLKDAVGGARNMIFLVMAVMAGPFLLAVSNLGIAFVQLGIALAPVLVRLGIMLAMAVFTFFSTAATAIGLASTAMEFFNIMLWANPIGLVVAGVVLLAAVAYLLYSKWSYISAFFTGIWDAIKAAFGGLAEWFTGIWDAVMGVFDAAFTRIQNIFGWIGRKLGLISSDTVAAVNKANDAQGGAAAGVGADGTAGAAGVAAGAAAARAGGTQANVRVDFNNLPPGARVTQDPRSTANVETNTGYAMGV